MESMTKDMAYKLALDQMLDSGKEWSINQVRELQNHILSRHEKVIKGMKEFDSLSGKFLASRMKNNQRKALPHTLFELSTKSAAEFLGEDWLSLNTRAERDAVKRMYNIIRERLISGDVI